MRKDTIIGIAGYGNIGKSVSDYLLQNDYQVHVYNRSVPPSNNCGIHYTDSINQLITKCDILINTLPSKAFHFLFRSKIFEGKAFLSYAIDLDIMRIKEFCAPQTEIQRIISSTAIKGGNSIILSTPSDFNVLEKLFPTAKIIYLGENLLLLGTILLSSSALSGLIISRINQQIQSNGFPIDIAENISKEIPKELDLLGKTWEYNFGKVYEMSSTKKGVTEELGKSIIDELDKSITTILGRKPDND